MVRADPRLRRLPIVGGVVAFVCAVAAVGAGAAVLDPDQASVVSIAGRWILIVAGAAVAAIVVVWSNVVLVAAAEPVLRGGQADLRAARTLVRRRAVAVAGWALLSSIAAVVLGFVRLLGLAGMIIGRRWAASWVLVTYCVAPVMVFEGVGPVAAVRRSTQLVHQHWGRGAAGGVVVGGGPAALAGLGVFFSFLGIALLGIGGNWPRVVGGLVLVVCIALAVGGAVACRTTRGVFGAALYRYLIDHQIIGPFSAAELERVCTTV
jgi:Family of unknown function (DUF6159)